MRPSKHYNYPKKYRFKGSRTFVLLLDLILDKIVTKLKKLFKTMKTYNRTSKNVIFLLIFLKHEYRARNYYNDTIN